LVAATVVAFDAEGVQRTTWVVLTDREYEVHALRRS
jgi:hypothetical protein